MDKRFLVIGLGSMGKRRIRCLLELGYKNIIGFDPREDRRKEASEKYGVEVVADFKAAIDGSKFDAWIISVPPDLHHIYMKEAIRLGVPSFIEASVVDTDLAQIIADADAQKVLLAPSCTLYYHPAIKKIFEIVKSGDLGTLSLFVYHSGQYLPDWHSYEPVSDYYVSNKDTGGAREIVPFELTWITQLIGLPKRVTGLYKKTIEIKGAENIEDTYSLLMDYETFIFSLTVDVVSRNATRRLTINGSKKQLHWNWEDNAIQIYDPQAEKWNSISYETKAAEDGYNKNITEGMYVEEVDAFLKAAFNGAGYPNNLKHDHAVLNILYATERASDNNQTQQL